MKVKLLTDSAIVPVRGSAHAAGYDLFADMGSEGDHAHIVTGRTSSIPTGIAIQIPVGYVGLIKPRSGLAFNKSVDTMAGVIDSDYRGEVRLLLTCHDTYHEKRVVTGDKLAQLVIVPCYQGGVDTVEILDDTERGENGFGSTGS